MDEPKRTEAKMNVLNVGKRGLAEETIRIVDEDEVSTTERVCWKILNCKITSGSCTHVVFFYWSNDQD